MLTASAPVEFQSSLWGSYQSDLDSGVPKDIRSCLISCPAGRACSVALSQMDIS